MLTIQEMLDIAMRYTTAMADAMVQACVQKAVDLGVSLRAVARPRPVVEVVVQEHHDYDDTDWERLMRENSDTRWNHC